jgi:hypothetical protein
MVQFLLAVLKKSPDGIFLWANTREAQEVVSERMGLSKTLQGLHWIRPTERPSQYQITQEFLRQYAPTVKLTLRTEARSESAPAPGTAVLVTEGSNRVADLLRQRSELERQLREELERSQEALRVAIEAEEVAKEKRMAAQADVDAIRKALDLD